MHQQKAGFCTISVVTQRACATNHFYIHSPITAQHFYRFGDSFCNAFPQRLYAEHNFTQIVFPQQGFHAKIWCASHRFETWYLHCANHCAHANSFLFLQGQVQIDESFEVSKIQKNCIPCEVPSHFLPCIFQRPSKVTSGPQGGSPVSRWSKELQLATLCKNLYGMTRAENTSLSW